MPRKPRADGSPTMVSLDDKRAAERILLDAMRAGELQDNDYHDAVDRVRHAVTPRDLWKATGGRAGSPKRADRAELEKAIRLQVAIVIFAILAMLVVLWGTILWNRQGSLGG